MNSHSLSPSKPIKINNHARSYSADLDTIHFSPPELRNRVETISWQEHLKDRIETISMSKSLPNMSIKKDHH